LETICLAGAGAKLGRKVKKAGFLDLRAVLFSILDGGFPAQTSETTRSLNSNSHAHPIDKSPSQ
jgi:hypothetical protein